MLILQSMLNNSVFPFPSYVRKHAHLVQFGPVGGLQAGNGTLD